MARYRGTVQGDRGEASRLGHRSLWVEANGWTIGGTMGMDDASQEKRLGECDAIRFTLTGGSNGQHPGGVVARAWEAKDPDNGKVIKYIRFPECFGGKTYFLYEGNGIEDPDKWIQL
jgi:hypothetical protein